MAIRWEARPVLPFAMYAHAGMRIHKAVWNKMQWWRCYQGDCGADRTLLLDAAICFRSQRNCESIR